MVVKEKRYQQSLAKEKQQAEIKDIALDFYGTGSDMVASANEL